MQIVSAVEQTAHPYEARVGQIQLHRLHGGVSPRHIRMHLRMPHTFDVIL